MAEGMPNPSYVNDHGIDGIRIKDGAIIQVKKTSGIGKPAVQSLLGVMTPLR